MDLPDGGGNETGREKNGPRGGWVGGCILMLTGEPYGWLLVWRRFIKEDECRRIEYEGENIDD
jgi:hypothetical protein